MRKMSYRLLAVLGFVCLYLAFTGSFAFGQKCGLVGLPPCPKKTTKKQDPTPTIRPSDSVSTLSPSQSQTFKSGSTLFQKSGGDSLLVSFKENTKTLVFFMEALNHFSPENSGEMHLYFDLNGNGKIDVSDIRYKIVRDGEGCRLESNYLSNRDFDSESVVGYSFMRTKNQSRPHPLWSITIPKKEIYYKTGETSLRFEYWSETCPNCVVRIPEYNITGRSNVRDENGLLDFGPVKKIEFTPDTSF